MRQFHRSWLRLLAFAMLMLSVTTGMAQGITLTGKVSSAKDNETLPGVTVTIKGTTKVTATDVNGSYRLAGVSATDVLVFTSVGFVPKEVAASAAAGNVLNVILTESNTTINEVVVVGYGTQKRRDITGSVVSIDKKRLEDMPNTNLAQALQGSVAGVSVTQGSGGAEGGNVSIQIRGRKSISAKTDPLIVLDGLVYNGSYSDINPTDIESVEVLKDASAVAIYGSRGSNGVLLITTKRGKTGKPVITYDGFYGTQHISNLPRLLTPDEFYAFKRYREPATAITATEQSVMDSRNFPNWVDLATQTGVRTQHSIGVSGGTDNSKYYVSTTYLDVKGVAVNDNFKRLSTRANFEANITKWLTYGTNTQLSYDDRSGANASFSGDYGAYRFNPLTRAYNADGSLTIYPWAEDTYFANPLAPTLADDMDKTYKIVSSNYLNVQLPVKGLSYRLNTGVEYTSGVHDTYYGRNTRTGIQNNGSATNTNGLDQNLLVENILNYNRTFGKHSIAFTGLYSYQRQSSRTDTLLATNFPTDVTTYYGIVSASSIVPKNDYTNSTLISQMARLNYTYNSKYLLTLTARRDGYSGFGANYKYGFFPSVALGWNISDEDFLKNNKTLTSLKLRLSYGSNGNQAVGPYSTLAYLRASNYVDGGTTQPGYTVSFLSNPNLHWETTNTFNAGIDFGFWNGRLQGTLDVYSAKTHDLLLNRRISTVSGVGQITQNIGKTQNNGIELGLNSTNITNKNITWSSNFNVSLNRNKILDLYGDGKNDTLNTWFVGHPIDVNYGYVYNGVWQTNDNLAASPQPNTKAGYAKVADLNHDGKITPSDKTIIGSLQPDFTYGFGNTLKYKQFTLYVFLQGVVGTSRANNLLADNVNSGVRYNTTYKNWWTPTNPTNDFWANDINANIYGVQIIQSTSYMRLKDASISYDLPDRLLKIIKLSRAKVYFDARNMLTVTKWKGLDPEMTTEQGIPMQKEFIFGLNISL